MSESLGKLITGEMGGFSVAELNYSCQIEVGLRFCQDNRILRHNHEQ